MTGMETPTLIGRTPSKQRSSPREDVRWVIPPLIQAPRPPAAESASLPSGYRLGAYVVTEARGLDGRCELYIVAHAERGSLHMGRVVQRAHAESAPAMLEAARRVQAHPQRNLLTVLETGWTAEAQPRGFIVHDRLVGRSVASLLAGRSEIGWPLVLAIGLQCADALDALHQHGLAHTGPMPASAALVHVAGDQFRIVLGGLDHAQTIRAGALASAEPRVGEDLVALGTMLTALATCSAASGAQVPSSLSCLLARMVDPRPALRPASAGELHDQLAAVRDHVDPDLSGVRMIGEAFRRITSDDFEVSIEASEPPPPVRAAIEASPVRREPPPEREMRPEQVPAPGARQSRGWRSSLWVGLVCFVAGASLRELSGAPTRPDAASAPTPRERPGLVGADTRHAAARLEAATAVTLPVVTLPRCDEGILQTRGRPTPPRASRAAVRSAAVEAPPELLHRRTDEEGEDLAADLLPIPIR